MSNPLLKTAIKIRANKLRRKIRNLLYYTDLVGIQLFFKEIKPLPNNSNKVEIGNLSDYITVYGLHYAELNVSGKKEFFLSNPKLFDIKAPEIFRIFEKGGGQTSYEIKRYTQMPPILGTHKKKHYQILDFFQSNIDFVVFPISLLMPILDYYAGIPKGSIILSGSQMKMGKKLSHRTNESLINYDNYYFTLKLEGEGGKKNWHSHKKQSCLNSFTNSWTGLDCRSTLSSRLVFFSKSSS